MGVRGPVPKRTEELMGHGRRAEREGEVTRVERDLSEIPRPAPRPEWHPMARNWYESLGHSGQSAFYEPSDWMTAMWLADQMSKHLYPKYVGLTREGDPVIQEAPMSGQEIQAFLKGMTSLLATEGDRRRAAIELGRRKSDEEEEATVLRLVQDDEERAFG